MEGIGPYIKNGYANEKMGQAFFSVKKVIIFTTK